MFRYDNAFFQFLGKITDYIFASVLWLICCIPVVTIGASTSALYYTVHKALKGERGYVWRCFWYAFRTNLKCTVGPSIIYVVAFLFLVVDKKMFYAILTQGSKLGMFYYIFYFLQLYLVGAAIVTFAFVARFTCTWKEAFQKGLILSIANFPWLLVIIVLAVAVAVIFVYSPIVLGILPALVCWVYDWILERIFRKLMTPEELAEDIALRQGPSAGE